MITGIGTDIVSIARFRRFQEEGNQALLNRLFTAQEQYYCLAKKASAASFAARFAAKEAFMKALGTGLRDGLSWHDMEVINDPLGKPELSLTGRALELYNERQLSTVLLSISHDGDAAIAMVVLESR